MTNKESKDKILALFLFVLFLLFAKNKAPKTELIKGEPQDFSENRYMFLLISLENRQCKKMQAKQNNKTQRSVCEQMKTKSRKKILEEYILKKMCG